MHFFPNPAHERLYVRIGQPSAEGAYRIFNTMGQLADTGSVRGSEFTIPVQNLPNGVYFLQLEIGRALTTKHFVKR